MTSAQLCILVAQQNYAKVVEILLAHQAQVDARQHNGATPWHWALTKREAEIIRLLLNYHPDLNARDFYRFTRLMQAAKLGEKAAAELLRSSGVGVKSSPRPRTALVFG